MKIRIPSVHSDFQIEAKLARCPAKRASYFPRDTTQGRKTDRLARKCGTEGQTQSGEHQRLLYSGKK